MQMRTLNLVAWMILAAFLAACGSNKIIQEQQARLDGQVAQNASGSVYDGGVRIDGTTQLEPRHNNFLYNVAYQDGSATHLPVVMRKHSHINKIVKTVLIENGLFYTGDLNRASGLLAPKSQAPYGLQIQAVGYFNEVLVNKGSLGSRILDSMVSGRPEHFSDEIMKRGSYEVKATYLFKLQDRRTGRLIDNKEITVSTTVMVKRNSRGYIDEARQLSDEGMLREATQRFVQGLTGQAPTRAN